MNKFKPHSAKLRKAQKKKLAKDVQEVMTQAAIPADSTLRIVGHALIKCHWVTTRGDLVCNESRSLARKRTLAVKNYVRSIGYTGSITRTVKAVKKQSRADTTDSIFKYTPPAPALGFTVVNATVGPPLGLTLGLSYACNSSTTDCTDTISYSNPDQVSGEVLESDPVLHITAISPDSDNDEPYAVAATNATCSEGIFHLSQGQLPITCTVTGNGAVITVIQAAT